MDAKITITSTIPITFSCYAELREYAAKVHSDTLVTAADIKQLLEEVASEHRAQLILELWCCAKIGIWLASQALDRLDGMDEHLLSDYPLDNLREWHGVAPPRHCSANYKRRRPKPLTIPKGHCQQHQDESLIFSGQQRKREQPDTSVSSFI
jgi:hypothetical protein